MSEFTILLHSQRLRDLTVGFRDDGIVQVQVDKNVEVDISHVKEVVNYLGTQFHGSKFKLLIIAGDFTLPTKETRDYLALPESDPYAAAEAYVVKSYAQKLVGNVYLNFNKPARPTRIFMDEDSALKWLNSLA